MGGGRRKSGGGNGQEQPKVRNDANKPPRWQPRQKPAGSDTNGAGCGLDGASVGVADAGGAPFQPSLGAAFDGGGVSSAQAAGVREARGRINGSFIPPGCDAEGTTAQTNAESGQVRCYEESVVKGFWIPPRLRGRNESLVEAVNDWHFAMLNDSHRNQFYLDAMAGVVKDKRVVDIGAGSGLLSLIASRQGAKDVVAIEASRDMVALARLNIRRNGCENIRVIHDLSSHVKLREEEKADVIVSETLGALMLGEGMLDYLSDARRRLAKPGATVIPAGGAQYAVLVSSTTLAMVSSVQSQCSLGFDLSAIGSLQDTGNLFFTKQWGFRLNSLPDLLHMSERVELFQLDFSSTERRNIPATKTFRVEALRDGIVHAIVASWEVWNDRSRSHSITTHPEDTRDAPWGFARDMQWGQGLQLIEDMDAASKSDRHAPPHPFVVKAGEVLLLTVRFSVPCRQTFQFTLRRASSVADSVVAAAAPATGKGGSGCGMGAAETAARGSAAAGGAT